MNDATGVALLLVSNALVRLLLLQLLLLLKHDVLVGNPPGASRSQGMSTMVFVHAAISRVTQCCYIALSVASEQLDRSTSATCTDIAVSHRLNSFH